MNKFSLKPLLCLAIVGFMLSVGGASYAQSISKNGSTILSADEARAELFGVWMEGETAQTKEQWSECIQPNGLTVYSFSGLEMVGKLEVREDGKACFLYETDAYSHTSCFRVSRNGDGYTFWGGVEGVFTTTSIQRNVSTCPSANTPMS